VENESLEADRKWGKKWGTRHILTHWCAGLFAVSVKGLGKVTPHLGKPYPWKQPGTAP